MYCLHQKEELAYAKRIRQKNLSQVKTPIVVYWYK